MVKKFWVKGKWNDTKRVRKELLVAWDADEAIDIAKGKGMIDGFEVTEDWSPPTERQLDYAKKLRIKVKNNMSLKDVSALISRKVNSDNQDPQPGLIEFARDHRLVFSDYIGKKALYEQVFHELDDIDRVAFFAFSIYRFISDDRSANLNQHTYTKVFYEFASSHINDKKFMSSMNRYDGKSIRFFGNLRIGNSEYTGGSTRTQAFDAVRQFLLQHNLIDESMPYHTKTIKPKRDRLTISKNHKLYGDPDSVNRIPTDAYKSQKSIYKWFLGGWMIFLLIILSFFTSGISLIPIPFIFYYRWKRRKE